jgi:hypothetical protein
MRWLPFVLVGLLFIAGAATPPAPSARPGTADRDEVFANHSDRTINEIYASPTNSEDWGPDRLGDATIEPGQSRRITLGPGGCLFDIQIVYNDAAREERRGVDVCRTRLLAFDASTAVPPQDADTGTHVVAIANQSGRPIQQVLISPAQAGDWGDDRLGNSSLSVGDTQNVSYRGDCLADLRIVFDNRSAEERRGLDLCALGGVTIRPGWTTADELTPMRPTQAAAAAPKLNVTIVNHSGRSLSRVYVYPEGAASLGSDQLGPAPLEDGAEVNVEIDRPVGACRFSARIVYGGKVPNQDLSGLDLCHEPTMIVPPRS